jgi:electron transfer flavoprotein alpha subunit
MMNRLGLLRFSRQFSNVSRLQSTLVIAEHSEGKLSGISLNAVSAASQLGGEVTCLVVGKDVKDVAGAVSKVQGVNKVIVADNEQYQGLLPERVTKLILACQDKFKFSHIVAGASAFGKGVIPRVAAKLDVGSVSEVTGIKSQMSLSAICTQGTQFVS